ncbi:type VII secretion-associated protein [Mycobacterium sp. 1100029.7]|nr:type VII secretion-associated protein [Mycobacterium sp. 1100029.7]
MSGHRTLIATGPAVIRRLCCGTSSVDETTRTAVEAIDDRVALVAGRPVAVDSLWRTALRSLDCGNGDLQVVHPSWWPASRIAKVAQAATGVGADAQLHPRSWLLRHASGADRDAAVVVEIAERLVAISGDDVVAVPRSAGAESVAGEVSRLVGRLLGSTTLVLLDVPSAVTGAPTLAALIAGQLRRAGARVVEIDDARLARLAASASASVRHSAPSGVDAGSRRSRGRVVGWLAAAAVVLAVTVPAMAPGGGDRRLPVTTASTTSLVEGRVALTVPEGWPAQRVVAGPGSARVQVTSPSDPEVALHITQSPIPPEALAVTAEQLKRAIDAEPAGVFVDFDPSGHSAGRSAVTYREVRASHHVRWAVLVDGTVRISVGCQSRPDHEDAVRDACEQAVRSARAIG